MCIVIDWSDRIETSGSDLFFWVYVDKPWRQICEKNYLLFTTTPPKKLPYSDYLYGK
jgi:hypothetical protein